MDGADRPKLTPVEVAVIIPAYNAAAFLAEAIDSVRAQTRAASELVIVDDGSTDRTTEIALQFPTARLVQQRNSGVSSARNRGARETSAEWLLFLDADDRLLRGALDLLLTRAARNDAAVVYGQTIYFNETTDTQRIHGNARSEGPVPAATRASFWKSAIATPGAALVRRELFEAVGGFAPEFDTLADRNFFLKAGMLTEFGFAGAPVIEKRSHAANMSGDLARAMQQAVEVQLGFLAWAKARARDTAFLNTTPAAIIDNQLRKGLNVRCLDGLHAVLEVARTHGIASPLMKQAARYVRMPPAAARLGLRVRTAWQQLTQTSATRR